MTQLKDDMARAAMKYDDKSFMKNSSKVLNFSRFHWMMTWSECIYLLLLLPLQANSSLVEQELSIRGVLNVPDPVNIFSHMAVYDKDTIFLGGTNYIYRVSTRNLTIEKLEKIGPSSRNFIKWDCYISNSCDNENDTVVKVLLINKDNDELIICTSLDGGTCDIRNISTMKIYFRSNPVLSDTDSHVAFLAPGPSKNQSSTNTVLYLAASLGGDTGFTLSESRVPVFSRRNIINFEFVSDNYPNRSYVNVRDGFTPFPIQYVYGFSSGIYSYVISLQKPGIDCGYITKLIRVCQYDEGFNSYAETSLKCCYQKICYNSIQAAYVGKPGRFLAMSLGVSTEEDVLFGMFGSGVSGTINTVDTESVLCIFPIKKVELEFLWNVALCFLGYGYTGPDYLTIPQRCTKSNVSIKFYYCWNNDLNTPIAGVVPVEASWTLKLDTQASSLTVAVTHNGETVAFVGTQSGELKKIKINNGSQAEEYSSVKVDVGRPILNKVFLDEDKKYLLLLTPKKLIKMEVEVCDQYETCDDCLRHPFCGWNFQLNFRCFFVDNATKSNVTVDTCPVLLIINQPSKLNSNTIQNWTHDSTKEAENYIIISLRNLPQLNGGQYECVYTGYGTELQISGERVSDNDITCVIPPNENISVFSSISDCFGFNLSVGMNKTLIFSTFVKFFRCDSANSLCLARVDNCTVHGFWSSFGSFGEWSNCSESCGGGIKNRKRFRTCTDPPPSDKGSPCVGEATDSEELNCNTEDCFRSNEVLIGITASASVAFIAILGNVIVVCICYHRKIRSMNKLYEHTFPNNFEMNPYQEIVLYNDLQHPDDASIYIELIEYNENNPYYSRPTDASKEEDDGYLKPNETESPYNTIKDVGKDESQDDQRENLCHSLEVETNIEDENI